MWEITAIATTPLSSLPISFLPHPLWCWLSFPILIQHISFSHCFTRGNEENDFAVFCAVLAHSHFSWEVCFPYTNFPSQMSTTCSQRENGKTASIQMLEKIKRQMKNTIFFQSRLQISIAFQESGNPLQEGFPLLLWQVTISNLRVTAQVPL